MSDTRNPSTLLPYLLPPPQAKKNGVLTPCFFSIPHSFKKIQIFSKIRKKIWVYQKKSEKIPDLEKNIETKYGGAKKNRANSRFFGKFEKKSGGTKKNMGVTKFCEKYKEFPLKSKNITIKRKS